MEWHYQNSFNNRWVLEDMPVNPEEGSTSMNGNVRYPSSISLEDYGITIDNTMVSDYYKGHIQLTFNMPIEENNFKGLQFSTELYPEYPEIITSGEYEDDGETQRYHMYFVPTSLKTIELCENAIVHPAAFNRLTNIKTIIINDDATKICPLAFYYSGVQNIVMNNNVKHIDDLAFAGAIDLHEINLPNSIEKIGMFSFVLTNLFSVEIPSSVEEIGQGAFAFIGPIDRNTEDNMTGYTLTNIKINGMPTFFDIAAFAMNHRLRSITWLSLPIKKVLFEDGVNILFDRTLFSLFYNYEPVIRILKMTPFFDCNRYDVLDLRSSLVGEIDYTGYENLYLISNINFSVNDTIFKNECVYEIKPRLISTENSESNGEVDPTAGGEIDPYGGDEITDEFIIEDETQSYLMRLTNIYYNPSWRDTVYVSPLPQSVQYIYYPNGLVDTVQKISHELAVKEIFTLVPSLDQSVMDMEDYIENFHDETTTSINALLEHSQRASTAINSNLTAIEALLVHMNVLEAAARDHGWDLNYDGYDLDGDGEGGLSDSNSNAGEQGGSDSGNTNPTHSGEVTPDDGNGEVDPTYGGEVVPDDGNGEVDPTYGGEVVPDDDDDDEGGLSDSNSNAGEQGGSDSGNTNPTGPDEYGNYG